MLRINEECKRAGITLKELARRMGISYQSLHAAASGNPKLSTIERMAKEIGCSSFDLLADRNDTESFRCPKCGARLRLTADDAERKG